MANEQTLNAEITKTLLTKPWSYWAERLDAANVPNAPVQSLEQAIEHPQTIASGLAQIVPGSDFRQMSLPLRFDGNRPAIRRPAPILGEANRDLFDDSGALMT
jgi:formyl-CoA transferase